MLIIHSKVPNGAAALVLPNGGPGVAQFRLARDRCQAAILGELFKLDGNGLVPGQAGGLLAHRRVGEQAIRHF